MSKIEDSVCADIQTRSNLGAKKYGVTMERTDLSETQWLQHAYEEALDLAVYLKKIMMERKFQEGQTLMWDFSSSDRREVTLLCQGSEKSCVVDKRGKWWIASTKDLEENTDENS